MCVHFFNFDHLRIALQSSDLIWGTKFRAPSLPLHPLIFCYLQALIHGFLWWWSSSWLIFSLKWYFQSSFFLLHSAAIHLQEAKDSIDEENPRPTSSIWSYIMFIIPPILGICCLIIPILGTNKAQGFKLLLTKPSSNNSFYLRNNLKPKRCDSANKCLLTKEKMWRFSKRESFFNVCL